MSKIKQTNLRIKISSAIKMDHIHKIKNNKNMLTGTDDTEELHMATAWDQTSETSAPSEYQCYYGKDNERYYQPFCNVH